MRIIKFAMKEKKLGTLLVTSASMGEGKSTIAANIAISFAQEGKKILLVDADLRRNPPNFITHLIH